jgi:hypothetical protein
MYQSIIKLAFESGLIKNGFFIDKNKLKCTYHKTVHDILYLITLKLILILIFYENI